MYRRVKERGFVSAHLPGRGRKRNVTAEAIEDNKERYSFTYADLFTDCMRYLNVNNVETIKKMTITEYMALRKGALLRSIDQMEITYDAAYKNALAGSFDKNGKPLIKSFKDMFDRKKLERTMLNDGISEEKTKENIKNFIDAKAAAERILEQRL